jgi:hypothetical protein
MRRYQILPRSRLIALIFLIIGIIAVVVLSIHSFININLSPRFIFRFIFYTVLILGLTGIGRGIVDFFELRVNYRSSDWFPSVNEDSVYEEIVYQTADYLTLFVGALLFLWLL